jgi:hypothetical protein
MSTQLKSEYVPGLSPAKPDERQPIERLIPYADNDRLHSEADLDRLSATNTEDQK